MSRVSFVRGIVVGAAFLLEGALLKHVLILAALMLAACALPGASDTGGLMSIMHPSQEYCASRELTLDAATKQCVTPRQSTAAPATTTPASAPSVTGSVPQVAQTGHSASPGPAAPPGPAASPGPAPPVSPSIPAALPAPAQPPPPERQRATRSVPIEPDAVIHPELAQDFDLMSELAHFVRASGYRCDSISALQPLPPSRGFRLVCNRFSYKYAIDNKDGRSIVTVE